MTGHLVSASMVFTRMWSLHWVTSQRKAKRRSWALRSWPISWKGSSRTRPTTRGSLTGLRFVPPPVSCDHNCFTCIFIFTAAQHFIGLISGLDQIFKQFFFFLVFFGFFFWLLSCLIKFVSVLQANLDEQQSSSNMFVRALMTCICQSAVICESAGILCLLH